MLCPMARSIATPSFQPVAFVQVLKTVVGDCLVGDTASRTIVLTKNPIRDIQKKPVSSIGI